MKNKKTIIIEDTNIWISFLIGSKHNDLLVILDDPDYKIMFCKELINELYESLKQPKLTKYYSKQDVNKLVRQIRQKAYQVDIKPPYPSRSRDKKDDYLLELAVVTKADYLISGDADLRTLKHIQGTTILSLSDFAFRYYTEKAKKYEKLVQQEQKGTKQKTKGIKR